MDGVDIYKMTLDMGHSKEEAAAFVASTLTGGLFDAAESEQRQRIINRIIQECEKELAAR